MQRVRLSVVVAVSLVCLAAQARAEDVDFYLKRAEDSFLKMDPQSLQSAVSDLTEALRLDPNRSDIYEMRGDVYSIQGEREKAIADFSQSIRLAPNKSSGVYKSRGDEYAHQGDYEKAIADYGQAIRLAPKNAEMSHTRGTAYVHQGEYDKAIADFTTAMRFIPPKDQWYGLKMAVEYDARADAWERKGRYDKAIADFEEAMRSDPDIATYSDLAWRQATCPDEKCRDGQKAYQNANKAYELSKGKYWRPLDILAAAYAECGDFAHARDWETKAIDVAKAVTDNSVTAKQIEEASSRLELYKQEKPYREEAKK